MLRSFYQFSSICSVAECVQGFGDLDEELCRAMFLMLAFAVLYGFLGLILNEPLLLNLFKFKKKSLNSSRASVTDYKEDEKEIAESGVEYVQMINGLPGNDPNHV